MRVREDTRSHQLVFRSVCTSSTTEGDKLSGFFLSIILQQFKNYEKRREETANKPLCLTEEEELFQEWDKLE
jgi:hypothetical protein